MKKINNLQELKDAASNGPLECFIQLKFGLRSSKNLTYDVDKDAWNVYHYIDDTEETLSTDELLEDTNIGKALDVGAIFKYKD